MEKNQDHLNSSEKIHKKPEVTPESPANELGFASVKLNYCLKA